MLSMVRLPLPLPLAQENVAASNSNGWVAERRRPGTSLRTIATRGSPQRSRRWRASPPMTVGRWCTWTLKSLLWPGSNHAACHRGGRRRQFVPRTWSRCAAVWARAPRQSWARVPRSMAGPSLLNLLEAVSRSLWGEAPQVRCHTGRGLN